MRSKIKASKAPRQKKKKLLKQTFDFETPRASAKAFKSNPGWLLDLPGSEQS